MKGRTFDQGPKNEGKEKIRIKTRKESPPVGQKIARVCLIV